jgi:hypothetical protein
VAEVAMTTSSELTNRLSSPLFRASPTNPVHSKLIYLFLIFFCALFGSDRFKRNPFVYNFCGFLIILYSYVIRYKTPQKSTR